MNKAFEKIFVMLEDTKDIEHDDSIAEVVSTRIWNKAIHRAKQIVKEVAEEYNGGWIACSERLPEKNGMYLCTQNSYDLTTNKNIIRVSTELVEFYNGKWRRAKNLVITHWQPLPEPYKERD